MIIVSTLDYTMLVGIATMMMILAAYSINILSEDSSILINISLRKSKRLIKELQMSYNLLPSFYSPLPFSLSNILNGIPYIRAHPLNATMQGGGEMRLRRRRRFIRGGL